MTASTASTLDPRPPAPELLTSDLLDTAAAAELLACTPRTVTNLITRGHLQALRLGPGRSAYRISAAALLAFAAQYGHHEPGDVAAASDPDQLPDFTPAPVLLEQSSADGLRLVKLYRPPDAPEQVG